MMDAVLETARIKTRLTQIEDMIEGQTNSAAVQPVIKPNEARDLARAMRDMAKRLEIYASKVVE